MMGTPYPKLPMHRIAYTKLTKDQISAKLKDVAKRGPECASPLAKDFAGQSMKIVTDDGPSLAYEFSSDTKLSVAENGGNAIFWSKTSKRRWQI